MSSKYGDGFKKTDATWAVDHLNVSWKQQAVQAGKEYLKFTHFSRQGLIEQQGSKYGDKFTHAQAVYAANQLGY